MTVTVALRNRPYAFLVGCSPSSPQSTVGLTEAVKVGGLDCSNVRENQICGERLPLYCMAALLFRQWLICSQTPC